MKLNKSILLSLAALTCVGCNSLAKVGSRAVVFDSDPFREIDQSRTAAAPAERTGGRAAQQPLTAPQPQATTPGSEPRGFISYETGHRGTAPQQARARQQHAARQASPPADGPGARAQADAAAMVARQQQLQQQPQGVQQAGFESFSPELTTPPDPFGNSGVHTADFAEPADAVGKASFDLSEEMLEWPPAADERMIPGTDLPVRPGRVSLESTVPVPSDFDPIPVPAPIENIDTQPVFSPPANLPAPTDAIPVPQPARREIIHESTNDSKWRAVRRS